MKKPRTVEELKNGAIIYWPKEIVDKENDISVIPLLLETQESFISVLKLANATPDAWAKALELNNELYPNLFLKHLCVISDVGGENLKRYATELPVLFKNRPFEFDFNGEIYSYNLTSLFSGKKWSNTNLGLDGKGITKKLSLNSSIHDVATLILFGSLSTHTDLPLDIQNKCILGEILGNKTELEKYIRQRYIWVSRQTGGAKSNSLGYLIEDYLLDILKKELPDWDFSKKSIEGITERTRDDKQILTTFDIVAKAPTGLCWAIESSFQFTTNSVIERKAGQAPARKQSLNKKGHKIAYAIDGAGNFERSAALQSLIESSDCIVNFSKADILRLAKTIGESIQ